MRHLALLTLLACSGGSDAEHPTDTSASSETGTHTTTPTPTPTDGTPTDATPTTDTGPDVPGIEGLLVDPTGAPLPQTAVLACTVITCLVADSDAAGRFRFEVPAGSAVAMKTHESKSPRWAAALEPIAVAGEMVDLGELYVPDLPAGSLFGPESDDPQTLDAGDGLTLTLSFGDLKPDVGVFLFDLAARKLPDEYVPVYPTIPDETVVAVYALHPFNTTSSSPIAVRAPAALAGGTAVNFRTVSVFDGALSAPVTGKSDGAFVTTDAGKGITALTYLVISAP